MDSGVRIGVRRTVGGYVVIMRPYHWALHRRAMFHVLAQVLGARRLVYPTHSEAAEAAGRLADELTQMFDRAGDAARRNT